MINRKIAYFDMNKFLQITLHVSTTKFNFSEIHSLLNAFRII
jgi:hypothetical protein